MTECIGNVRQDGAGPLFLAAEHGHADIVARLIEGQADIRTKDYVRRRARDASVSLAPNTHGCMDVRLLWLGPAKRCGV